VTLVARDEAALKSAAATLPGDGHSWHAVDVTDRGAWASLPLGDMSGLVCAAALLEPIGPIGSYDIDAFRRTMDVNVVGTLLAIEACLPALRAAGGSIVTFSGGVVRLTENLSPAIAPVAINAVAPGFVATEIHQATLDAGPELVGHAYYERTRADLAGGGFPAEDAARLVAMLLDRPPFTGKLISAQWDPWQDSVFISRLAAENDLGTLRRIDDQFFVRVADE
jgi:3-oxoacyl-[acyl-carrier protein] reductase